MDELPDKRDMRARRMLMTSAALGNAIGELWDTYNELFRTLDLNNPEVHDMMLGILVEYEDNLHEILGEVYDQIYTMTGVYEPLPNEAVDDFESSILRTIGDLDTVNLEDYRITEEDYEND